MRKILFLVYFLDSGGVSSSLSCLYNYLKNTDCEARIFPFTHEGVNSSTFIESVLKEDRLLSAYYRVSRPKEFRRLIEYIVIKCLKKLGNRIGFDIRDILYSNAQKKIFKQFIPEVVVAYQESDVTRFGASFSQKKKIAWIHFDYSRSIPAERDEKDIYSQFNDIICVSKYTAGTFVNRYPVLKDRVRTIYNLLDEARILSLSKEIINDEAFQTDRFTILSAGRISPEKGFSDIPAMASQLKKAGCHFRWYILGREDKKNEQEKLRNEIISNKVDDCVAWIGVRSNPYPYFKSSDLYVSTSYSEACPMVFNEARVLGVPIVSTDFGSSYEFIKDGKDGFIATRDELPSVLIKVIQDKSVYNRIKEGAENYVLEDKAIHQQINSTLMIGR